MSAITAERRDAATVKKQCGVRVNPTHWAARAVHSFRTWTGETALVTWCGINVDLADGGAQTTDTITCLQCAQASYTAVLDWVARAF